jgi:purine-binding chemotaxis protein CheW
MKKSTYLIFSLNKYICGINTGYIDEVCALPELIPTLKLSLNIIGTVNIRGDILPVIDLNLYFGNSTQNYRLTDSLVILKYENLRVGIIVNKIQEVKSIDPKEIITDFSHNPELSEFQQEKIVFGIIGNQQDIFILHHPENWFQNTELQDFISEEIHNSQLLDNSQFHTEKLLSTKQSNFQSNATLQEKEVFRERANSLKLSTEIQDVKNLRPLTVFELNGDFFSIDLKLVREFTDVQKITPIPCCPAYIIGNMNLRGEILTLIDIGRLLNLPSRSLANASKVMVIEVENIVVGLVVEDVCDVMFLLNPQEIKPIHPLMYSNNKDYLQGTVPYREKMMCLVNLEKILLTSGLIVDETI